MALPPNHRGLRIAIIIVSIVGLLVVVGVAIAAFLYLNVWWKPGP